MSMGRAKGGAQITRTANFNDVLGSGRGLRGAQAQRRNAVIAVETAEREAAATVGAQRQALKDAAATLSHIGDYGWLFWHPHRGQIVWVAADSDGSGTSTTAEIERTFAALDHVNSVEVICEGYHEDFGDLAEVIDEGELDNGWVKLAHEATVKEDIEEDGSDAASEAEDDQWREAREARDDGGEGTWVRPGHETVYRAWVDRAWVESQNS